METVRNQKNSQAAGHRLLAIVALFPLAAGLWSSACRSKSEPEKTPSPASIFSKRITDNFAAIKRCLDQIKSDAALPPERLVELYNRIHECCGDLLGKNTAQPVPTAQDWGNIAEEAYQQLMRAIRAVETNAALCRDYARKGRLDILEVQRMTLIEKAEAMNRLVEKLGAPNRP
ncbi:MAG: hypothetical protein N3D11_04345 [Candidatus Sumerlaeia bacterium]|nr:hypothetical protein [Candidatus Sumerlaeia bacterium]